MGGTDSESFAAAFSRSDAARICKVTPQRLRAWERAALVEPSAVRGRRRAFAFRDLVRVRSLRGLVENGVSLSRIRRSVEAVRQHIPELRQPLEALRVWMRGSDRVVVRHQGVLIEPDGQTVIDFARAGLEAASVAELEPVEVVPSDDAIAWFERGCALDSDPATYVDAAEAYQKALEIDPDFADALCNLGSVYFSQRRREAARSCFERAIGLDPEHPEAHLNLATLLEEDGHNPAALRHYRAALAASPGCPDVHVSLALVYEKLGLASRAREHWQGYLSLEPHGAWADFARRRLRDR